MHGDSVVTMPHPSIYLGDFTEERTSLLCSVSRDMPTGMLLRSMWIHADPLDPSPVTYWTVAIGAFGSGEFVASRTVTLQGGVPATPLRVDFTPEVRVPIGSVLAVRLIPSGSDVVPLTGVSVVPEYVLTSARAR